MRAVARQEQGRRSRVTRLRALPICMVTFGLSGVALAGPLATNGISIPGFTGTTAFDAPYNGGTQHLLVNLDFAVFLPGTYPLAQDPSHGTQFVYAYQAYNVSPSGGRQLSAL